MALRPPIMAVRTFMGPDDEKRSIRALNWLMFGLSQVNREYFLKYPSTPRLYDSGVYYKALPGIELWQDVPRTLEVGTGDCKVLACYRIGELQAQGIMATPYITGRSTPEGNTIFHALVRWPNGLIEDPSRTLGMCGYLSKVPIIIGYDGRGLPVKGKNIMPYAVNAIRRYGYPSPSDRPYVDPGAPPDMLGWHFKLHLHIPKGLAKLAMGIGAAVATVYPPAAPFIAAGIVILKRAQAGDAKALAHIAEVQAAAATSSDPNAAAALEVLQASQHVINNAQATAQGAVATTQSTLATPVASAAQVLGALDMRRKHHHHMRRIAAMALLPHVGATLALAQLAKLGFTRGQSLEILAKLQHNPRPEARALAVKMAHHPTVKRAHGGRI